VRQVGYYQEFVCDKSVNFYTTLSHIFMCASCLSKHCIFLWQHIMETSSDL